MRRGSSSNAIAILRAWCGEIAPESLAFDVGATPLASSKSYEWRAFSVPDSESVTFDDEVRVAGLFGFPTRGGAPFVVGFGARPALSDALGVATREAMQLLAFLWGEPIAERPPDPAPVPLYHLELFQSRAKQSLLRQWLDGEHVRYAPRHVRGSLGAMTSGVPRIAGDREVRFVDLTPPWLIGGAFES